MANNKPKPVKESADKATRKEVAELKEKIAQLYVKSSKLDKSIAESQKLLDKVTYKHKQIQKYGSAVPYHQHHHVNAPHGSSSNAPGMSTMYLANGQAPMLPPPNTNNTASHSVLPSFLHGGNFNITGPPLDSFDADSYWPS
ncbi:hypothetical protein FGRMN_895 [Fusarium graminum]|nr:hypothetical protein FGRMN_895 [Fusarium graminum]